MQKDDKDKIISQLLYCLRETLWMAGRYAEKRQTYAPWMFNEALKILDDLGYQEVLPPDKARGNRRYVLENESHY